MVLHRDQRLCMLPGISIPMLNTLSLIYLILMHRLCQSAYSSIFIKERHIQNRIPKVCDQHDRPQ